MRTPILSNASSLRQPCQADASIVLVGFEGAGKKTLGIIASIALKRQYVEFNRFFAKDTGKAPSTYIELHGFAKYRDVVPEILHKLLETHRSNSIISGLPQICLPAQKQLLYAFSGMNPVLYVRRNKEELPLFSSQALEESKHLYSVLDAFYKSCSNIDYFNISREARDWSQIAEASTLKLKDVEVDFVRFVLRIFGQVPCLSYSKDPFSQSYTYALQISPEYLETKLQRRDLECGADAINCVIKCSEMDTNLHDRLPRCISSLRQKTKMPVILDVIDNHTDPTAYFKLLALSLRTVPDAMTIDLSKDLSCLGALVSIRGVTKLIGTYHHTGSWKDLQEHDSLSRMRAWVTKLSLHALRISADANHHSDNWDCFEAAQTMRRVIGVPIMAFNTGRLGRMSICLSRTLAPVVPNREQNTGVTIRQARSALFSTFILEPKKFTIIGSSVSYSLSPAMHNAGYASCGMPHSYGVHQTDNFEEIHHLFRDPRCGGVSVSMPFKTLVLPLLDRVAPEAQEIGAVNTVVISRHHFSADRVLTELRGFNTDHVGIRESIIQHLSPANSIRARSTALILGAGGMARATIYALRMLGVENMCIFNRTNEHGRMLAKQYTTGKCKLHVLNDLEMAWPSHLEQPTMIISTIPAHRVHNTPAHALNIPDQWLQSTSGGTFIEVSWIIVILD